MDTQEQINKLQSLILEAEAELASEDYMTIRESEGGEPMPNGIKDRRVALRAEINDWQTRINDLQIRLESEQEGDNGNFER